MTKLSEIAHRLLSKVSGDYDELIHADVQLLIRTVRQSQEMRLDVIHIRKWSKQEAGDLSAGQILEAIQRMTTEALLKFDSDVLALLEE